jgi:hypothetical protein
VWSVRDFVDRWGQNAMTSLELMLADVLASIEHAKSAGNVHALVALLQRKQVICQALAAPEQAWLEPDAGMTGSLPAPHPMMEAALAAA